MTSKWPHINSHPKDVLSIEGVVLGSKENTKHVSISFASRNSIYKAVHKPD